MTRKIIKSNYYERKYRELLKKVEDIKHEIEQAMGDFYYFEQDLEVREGLRFALEIIDKHIGKEHE